MQVCCRDRNRLALQGDLLAAHALGVPNVMAVAGEEITHGDHHQAKAVYDINLLELISAIGTMRTGRDMAGVDLKGRPNSWWALRSRCRPSAEALKEELADLDQKIAAGARFFTTQPVFEVAVLENFRQQVGQRQAAIIPTVMLLKSVGMARYINRHMEMKIPEEFITRIQKAPTGCGSVCRSPRKSSPPSKRKDSRECSSPPSGGRINSVDPGVRPVFNGFRRILPGSIRDRIMPQEKDRRLKNQPELATWAP